MVSSALAEHKPRELVYIDRHPIFPEYGVIRNGAPETTRVMVETRGHALRVVEAAFGEIGRCCIVTDRTYAYR